MSGNQSNFFRLFTISCGIGFSLIVEFSIRHYKKLVKIIKKTPNVILSGQPKKTLKKQFGDFSFFLISTRIQPFGEKNHFSITNNFLFPIEDGYFFLNTRKAKFVNPRRYTNERLLPPVKFLFDLILGLLTERKREVISANGELFFQDKYSTVKLTDAFSFFRTGDYVTLLGKNNSRNIIDTQSTITFKPFLVIQGTKLDLINYYKDTVTSLEFFRYFTTFPLLIYLVGDVVNRALKFYFKSKKVGAGMGTCCKCHEYNSNILFKDCNHFILCSKCFVELGKKCPICNIEKPEFLYIKN